MKSLLLRKRRRGLPRHWPAIIPIALGVGFLALAALTAAPTIQFAMKAVRTQGTFVGAIARAGGKTGSSFYHPMFRYAASDGSVRTFTAQGGSTSPAYADGAKAPVWYDPEQPDNAKLATFAELWLRPLAVGVPGLLLAALGVLLLAGLRRRDRAG